MDIIWWHVYPLGATGAPIRGEHDCAPRLRALTPWLDYLIELGCKGLLLGPIFASVSHGYDTLDHYRIDPRLGGEEDFEELISQCQRRGINVMLDGVFNHVARTHPMAGEGCWEGHEDLANLNHADPAVQDMVVDVMLYWLRRGIAGWRLDVAYSVPPEFWRSVLGRVREEFPDAIFLGEVIHGDYAAIAQAGTLTTVTQYELWKALWSSIRDVNFWELDHAIARHATLCEAMVPNTFVGNHDVDRIASKIGQLEGLIAFALLLVLPGMPSIYYGDEQGFEGVRSEGFAADDAVRPALPATPEQLSPLGAWVFEEYKQLIGLRRRHPALIDGTCEVLAKTNESISIRNGELVAHAWLEPTRGVEIKRGEDVLYRLER